jgi:hypothetical protein
MQLQQALEEKYDINNIDYILYARTGSGRPLLSRRSIWVCGLPICGAEANDKAVI